MDDEEGERRVIESVFRFHLLQRHKLLWRLIFICAVGERERSVWYGGGLPRDFGFSTWLAGILRETPALFKVMADAVDKVRSEKKGKSR